VSLIDTILVDDNRICLDMLTEICETSPNINIVGSFTDSVDAAKFAASENVDFAILDIDMPRLNGIELGNKLRGINPNVFIFYITGREEYCAEAVKNNADFIIFKPLDIQKIRSAIERVCLLSELYRTAKPEVRTFGRFDVFCNNKAIHFSNAKAKELFALCIDHLGGEVSMEEAIDKLWPDKPYDNRAKKLYRKAVTYLKTTFEQYTDKEVFRSTRGSCYVVPENIKCDYFDYVNKRGNINAAEFIENYMFNYPWTESTVAKYYFS